MKESMKYLHRSQLHFLLEFQNTFLEEIVGIHEVFNRLTTMDYGCMVAATKMLPDGFE